MLLHPGPLSALLVFLVLYVLLIRQEHLHQLVCDQVKYLGVIVDKQLNWKRHIEQVRNKCLSGLAILCKVRRALPPKLKSLLYLTIVQPYLDYCSVVWMEYCKHDAIKLERVQKVE